MLMLFKRLLSPSTLSSCLTEAVENAMGPGGEQATISDRSSVQSPRGAAIEVSCEMQETKKIEEIS